MPRVGTTLITPVEDLTSRSGHWSAARLLRSGKSIVGCGTAASGDCVGLAEPAGVGTNGHLTGSPVSWTPSWIFAAIARISGILAYRYLPGQAVWPTSR